MNSTGQQTRRNSDSAPAGRFQPAGPEAPKGTGQAKVPPGRTWLWFLGILLANYLLMRFFVPSPDAPVTVPYTLFAARGREGQRRGDPQPGRDHHGPLQGAGHLPAGGEKSAAPNRESKKAGEKSAAPTGEESQTASEGGAAPAAHPKRSVTLRPPCLPS